MTHILLWNVTSVDQILPRLFIGNSSSAKDLSFLSSSGISRILSCGSEFKSGSTFPDIERVVLDIQDNEWLEGRTEAEFDRGVQQLRTWMDGGETVLVHCKAGVSRSVTTVLLYLMGMGWTLSDAFAVVHSGRPRAYPYAMYWRLLLMRDEEAKRARYTCVSCKTKE